MAVRQPASPDRPLILIGFAEAMAAIETAWSLLEAGYRVAAFGRAGSRPALRRVRGAQVHEIPGPEHDAAAAVTAAQRLCHSLRPAAVLPLDDHAVWVCSHLRAARLPVAGASGPAAEYALDKSLQIDAALRAGIPVPPTEVVKNLADTRPASYPVMVKPARALHEAAGLLLRPTGVVCADDGEFGRAAARTWPGSVLVQPLIRGAGEGLFGHAGPRGVVAWSAHQRVRMVNPQGSASSACRSAPVDGKLIGPAERFLREIGWQGLFMLEFLRDADGQPWFMELNGRTWGSMALARRRGFEYPAWTVRSALDPGFEPDPPRKPPEIVCRNLGLEIVHLAFVARGPQSAAAMNWPPLRRSVRDVCRLSRGDRLYNWNRSQPGVLAADTLATLRQYAGKIAGRRA